LGRSLLGGTKTKTPEGESLLGPWLGRRKIAAEMWGKGFPAKEEAEGTDLGDNEKATQSTKKLRKAKGVMRGGIKDF